MNMAPRYLRSFVALCVVMALQAIGSAQVPPGSALPPGYPSVGPNGLPAANPNFPANNDGPSSPVAPTQATRPSSWPGAPQNAPPPGQPAPAQVPQGPPRKPLSEPPYDPAMIVARVGSEVI